MTRTITKETDVLLGVQNNLNNTIGELEQLNIEKPEMYELIDKITECKCYCLALLGAVMEENMKNTEGNSI